jgi:CheY-like chemotaxis protein
MRLRHPPYQHHTHKERTPMAHILVIDDEADIHFILKTFLTGEGHTVDTAGDGKAGLKLAELHVYDLIITDIVMPEMDGLEVIAAIKSRVPATKIIALTGGSAKLDKTLLLTTAKAMRANKVIAKPINLHELRDAVTEVLTN